MLGKVVITLITSLILFLTVCFSLKFFFCKIKISNYYDVTVMKLYSGGVEFHYLDRYPDYARFDEWLRYNEKQYYCRHCELFRIHFIKSDFVLIINPRGAENPDGIFDFSENEKKVFYHGKGSFFEYSRDLTEADRDFMEFLRKECEKIKKEKGKN